MAFPWLLQNIYTLASQELSTLSSILAISIFFFSFFLVINHKRKIVQTSKLPPGPKKLPFIGNLHQLGASPQQSLQRLSGEHGPLMFLKLGSIPTLVISSADMAREVFKNHDRVFSGRPVLYAAEKISYGCSDVTFAPYGAHWREVRKIVILELLSQNRVQMFKAVRAEDVALMVDSISHSSSPIDLSELVHLLANDNICRVAFSKKYGNSSFYELLKEIEDMLGGFTIADFFPWMRWFNKFNGLETRLENTFKELDKLYDKVIKEHLDPNFRPELDHHEDLVDVLLRVQKDPNQAITLTNKQLKGVLTDMFLAGTDTSSASLEWTMAELIRNPLVMRRAQEEVREVVKAKGKVEESDLSQLMYLKLVIKESLRLHLPVPLLVPRETIEDCTFMGYDIPAKTRVFINAKSLAMDPECWENPNEFWPERFLDSPIDFMGQHFEFLPFGAGRRGCPGLNLSLALIELALANLLYSFDWKLPDGMNIEDLDMEESFGLVVHTKTPLRLVASPVIVHS